MRFRGRRGSIPCPYRVTAWLLVLALLAPALPAGAQEAPAVPDISRLIPANAAAVAALDLRSEEPTVKLILEQLRPQERAIGAAMLALAAQAGLSALASGLDFERDVLPWVGRRVYLAGIPTADGFGMPQLMALVEVKDAEGAQKALEVILPKAVAAANGKLFQRPIGDVLLRHVAIPGFGHLQLMLRGGALALSPKQGLLEEWTKQPAGSETSWTKVMGLVKPGPLVVALTPKVAGMFGDSVSAAGLTAAALSVSASQPGTRLEIALQAPTGPAGKAVEQMGRMAVTGEALGAVPESAVAALSVAPLEPLLNSLGGKELLGAGVQELLGRQAAKVMPGIQPALDNVLKSEVAVALMALAPQPRILAVVAEPDEDAADSAVSALREALTSIRDARVKPGDGGGFTVALPADGPKFLREIHVARAGKWLLAATDAETLSSSLATARAPRPAGLAASASYNAIQEQIGTASALALYADTRALGRAFTSLGYQEFMKGKGFNLPEKYVARLVDAFLLPLGGTGLNLSAHEGAGRLTLFQQVDWQSAAGAGAATPAALAVGAAVAMPALARARKSARGSGAVQTLKGLRMGEEAYRAETNRYGNLNQLKAKGLSTLGEGGVEPTSDYRFRTKYVKPDAYLIVAEPPKPDLITYTMNENGEITP